MPSVLPPEEYFDEKRQVPDHWSVFGLKPSDGKELKKAVSRRFRELAVALHPDKNPEVDTLKEFQRLSLAKEVLLDDDQRRKYIKRVEKRCKMGLDSLGKRRKVEPQTQPAPRKAATPLPSQQKVFNPSDYTSEQLTRLEKSFSRRFASYPLATSHPDTEKLFAAMDRLLLSRIREGSIQSSSPSIPTAVINLYTSDPVKYWYLQFTTGKGEGHLLYCARVNMAKAVFNEVLQAY
eukprot:TRINITY_DN43833_c0_g1_i1.p1 TRINITY_DN43833_c0_g1~~TRINITY_DN43833_c0_g1_i1.p1  ORF type:complete len:235 (+),score=45.64 TRINITY_DN43833_c0_g1_i1:48-752(+)